MDERVKFSFLRDKRTHFAWLLLVLAWASFRAVAINKFFGAHSVNAWGYLVVDLTASIPYAYFSAQAVVNFLDKSWSHFRKNAILTAIFFYIPDLYVIIFARKVPASLYLGFAITVAIFSILALFTLTRDAGKSQR